MQARRVSGRERWAIAVEGTFSHSPLFFATFQPLARPRRVDGALAQCQQQPEATGKRPTANGNVTRRFARAMGRGRNLMAGAESAAH